MRTLGQVNAAWAGDSGDPDPVVRDALGNAARGTPDYLVAVAALCGTRLLLPIVATGDEGGPATQSESSPAERHAEMAAVLITADDGSTGVLAFTGLDALRAFDPAARPVLCTVDEVAATATETGAAAVIIDLAGPHRLVIEDPLLAELAAGRRLVRLDEGWAWLSVADPD